MPTPWDLVIGKRWFGAMNSATGAQRMQVLLCMLRQNTGRMKPDRYIPGSNAARGEFFGFKGGSVTQRQVPARQCVDSTYVKVRYTKCPGKIPQLRPCCRTYACQTTWNHQQECLANVSGREAKSLPAQC